MKLYMTMKVEGFDGGHADALVEIDDGLFQFMANRRATYQENLAAQFIANELRAYVETMALKNIEMGAIHLEKKP